MIRAATPSEIMAIVGELPLPYSASMRGVTNGGAMVIYDGWTPNSVQVHVYSRDPASLLRPDFIREIFHYPFVQANRRLLVSVTPAHAESSLALSRALGFKETYRIRDGWAESIDMVVKEMRREECRYLRMH